MSEPRGRALFTFAPPITVRASVVSNDDDDGRIVTRTFGRVVAAEGTGAGLFGTTLATLQLDRLYAIAADDLGGVLPIVVQPLGIMVKPATIAAMQPLRPGAAAEPG